MLGVKLFAKFQETKSKNGEDILSMVKEKINLWRSGKYMSLTSRPFSVNTYALSKLWYRVAVTDIKVGDCDKIYSSIKSWMYADLIVKPQEELIFRSIKEGGLGLQNIQAKASANLITSFIQTSINKEFITNDYSRAIFDYYINEVGCRDPGRPPWISGSVISEIKEAIREGVCIQKMKIKDWYLRLIEKVTHEQVEDGAVVLKQSRMEFLYPHIDHLNSARNIRQEGLHADLVSVLFMLKNDLLPTKERLKRLNLCEREDCEGCGRRDDQGHYLVCVRNSEMCRPFLEFVAKKNANIQFYHIIHCDFSLSLNEGFSCVWILAQITKYIWACRRKGVTCDFNKLKGILSAEIKILAQMHMYEKRVKRIKYDIGNMFNITL